MPNYYNPYNFYPVSYQGYSGNIYPQMQQPAQIPQQNYSGAVQQSPKMMEWVEGEVGAKAFQMPNGWPANSPIPLWDSTDTVIYLKSWGPMGIPNPLQKLRYEMPEQQNQALLTGMNNGMSGNNQPDMSQYVTKQDLDEIRKEMRNALSSTGNQNGSGNGQQNMNRGGNRNG